MKSIKNILALLLAMITLLSTAACEGVYDYAIGGEDGTGGSEAVTDGEFVPPEMNDDPTDDFTVTVMADGQAFSPAADMFVYWSDGFSVHVAQVDKEGVARIDGLDGDYKVTLQGVPYQYTYDPNTNLATNDDRNIVVDMYTLNRLSGSGTGIYDCYQFTKTGVYCAVIEDPDDAIYFQYAPDGSGTYSIESWMDTTADDVNPYVEIWGGHSEFKYYIATKDDGGSMGSYTINFLHTVQIADENISSGGGGQATYTFAIKAESKTNRYPITVTFAVKRNGGFELNYAGKITGMAIPTYDFSKHNKADHEYGADHTLTYPEYRFAENSNIYVFDEDRFKLWETKDGGDGFYHVYDKEKYASTKGYGPILYANIKTNCRFIDRPFNKIEYNQSGETINAALSAGGLNYKHFIEGYTFLSTYGNINGGSYYCNSDCLCHDASVSNADWACTAACTKCDNDCRRIPEELIGCEGYQSICNSDGMAPVTKELRDFLQAYCMKQQFFWDGKGTVENQIVGGKMFQAVGESGWLFACAYYEKN